MAKTKFAFGGDAETNHINIRLIKPRAMFIKLDYSLPIYIQRHALRRLAERIGIVSGVLHQAVVRCFQEDTQTSSLRQGSTSLVEFNFYDQKLGYLVCLVHEEMIVIRTFLFLTNDGTPEGKKLANSFLVLSNSGLLMTRP